MLSGHALLAVGDKMDGHDDDSDEEKEQGNETVGALPTWEAALEQSKETIQDVMALADLPDSKEVAKVAILLDDVPRPWSPPARLRKVAEAPIRYFDQPRVLVVVALKRKDERSETATTQMMRLHRIIHEEKLGMAVGGEGQAPLVWPLQHKKTVQMLGAKVLFARDGRSLLGTLSCPFCLRRCTGDSGAGARTSDIISLTAKHYGGEIAFPFAWTRYYARSLWVFIAVILPLVCVLGGLQQNDMMTVELDEDTLGSASHVLSEMIKLVSVVWMLLVAKEWPCPDLSGGAAEQPPREVEGRAPRCCGETGSKVLTAVCGLLVLVVELFIAMLIFAFIFWLEMYITFEWGDCINLGCRDPAEKWGFLGWLVGITPGILEAIFLALFTEVSLLLADFLLWVRNYEHHEDKMRFKFVALVALEALAKLGTFGVLAMVFVPEWDDESTMAGLPAGFSSMTATEQRIARNDIDCSDLPDVAMIGRGALLCVRRRLDAGYRRWLFQKAMTGPFCVAPFIAILIKVLLPIVLQYLQQCFWRCERRERVTGERHCCLECCPTRFVIRAAGLIFAYDGPKVGCLRFLSHGNPFHLGIPKDLDASTEGAEAGASEGAGASGGGSKDRAEARWWEKDPNTKRLGLVRQGLREIIEKRFNSENMVLDNLLSIQWVGFFTVVWPWGVLPTLLAWVLQTRSTWALLLISKRRVFPETADVLQQVSRKFVLIMVHLTALWHVALSVVTYNSQLSTMGAGVIVGLLVGLWLAVVILMWLLAVVAHHAGRHVTRCTGGDQDTEGRVSV